MKRRFLSFCGVALAICFSACNSSDTATTDGKDSANNSIPSNSTSDVPTTSTSVGNYAALADSVRINTEQGYYLNPKTGKPYKNLKVDATTGQISDDAGMPVRRYVDSRSWWVYGDWDNDMTWEQESEAKMQNDKIMYKGDGDAWVDYDAKWKMKDDEMEKKWKSKDGNIKIKTEKDGDTKIKVGDEKIKIDEDGTKKKN